MHSRIFGLTTDKNNDYKMSENDYERYERFADYVSEEREEEQEEDIEWLQTYLGRCYEDLVSIDIKERTIVFHKGFKRIAFLKMLSELQDELDEVRINGIDKAEERHCMYSSLLYGLKSKLCDDFSFHYELDGYDVFNPQEFIAYVEEEKIYYVYGVLDYHY